MGNLLRHVIGAITTNQIKLYSIAQLNCPLDKCVCVCVLTGSPGGLGLRGLTGPRGTLGFVGQQGLKGKTGTHTHNDKTKSDYNIVTQNIITYCTCPHTGQKGDEGLKGERGPMGPMGSIGKQGLKGQ